MIEGKPLLPSISSQADDLLRHRLSDMSVSRPQDFNKILSPLEPTNFESYSRRGSVTDPHGYHRRPSITESRRGSIATTDYDYSSRSPSPSPLVKRYHENDASPYALNRRDSLPNNNILYDPFQRRHSIATAEPLYNRAQNTNNSTNTSSSSIKYKCKYTHTCLLIEYPC